MDDRYGNLSEFRRFFYTPDGPQGYYYKSSQKKRRKMRRRMGKGR